ncbi:MAG: hypothetical protein GY729_04235 [Desulfobacteraceae bacterium]|nr:hypothetical protein [Desulfobacteraceae bacterium]
MGKAITDTQTGLRGIPKELLPALIELKSSRYAYELEMLLTLTAKKTPVKETPITTVYEDNNAASSFRPVTDSFLIYKTLFMWWCVHRFFEMVKYSLSSITSTIADFGTYILLIHLSQGFVSASIAARIISVIIHFSANKYFTFSMGGKPTLKEIGKYLMVVLFNLSGSIFLIYLFVTYLLMGEVAAKVAAQLLLFITTYVLLNGFVFLGSKKS